MRLMLSVHNFSVLWVSGYLGPFGKFFENLHITLVITATSHCPGVVSLLLGQSAANSWVLCRLAVLSYKKEQLRSICKVNSFCYTFLVKYLLNSVVSLQGQGILLVDLKMPTPSL